MDSFPKEISSGPRNEIFPQKVKGEEYAIKPCMPCRKMPLKLVTLTPIQRLKKLYLKFS